MSEHYTKNTESVWKWCYHCRRLTEHPVTGGRVGRCAQSHAKPKLEKIQTPPQPTLWDETKAGA